MEQSTLDYLFLALLIISQAVAIIAYAIWFKHIRPGTVLDTTLLSPTMALYPYFQDVHIMIYVGFGFLLTSFHRFRLSALTHCFWVAAIAFQYYFLWSTFWKGVFHSGEFESEIHINVTELILGEVSAGAVLIAVCAIIGKTNSLQFLIISLVSALLYTLNETLTITYLKAFDVGGSMIIHTFGAFYGIGITFMYQYPMSLGNLNLIETHDSLTSAMIGTLFLWCFWPSFNAALAPTPAQIHSAVLNTYFSLVGSVVMAYAVSLILGKGKFKMSQILNATLAGGVIMGAYADILPDGWVAYLIGCLAGVMSCLLFQYAPAALDKIGIHDVAGVFNLHGVPGFLSGIISAIVRAKYVDNQGWRQAAAACISLGIGLGGGLIVGFLTKHLHHYSDLNHFFNDKTNVALEEFVEAHLDVYGGGHHAPAENAVLPVPTKEDRFANRGGTELAPITERQNLQDVHRGYDR